MVVTVAELVQLFYWIVLQSGYEYPHIHYVVILIAGGIAWRYAGDEKYVFFAGIIGSLLTYCAVIYLSNLEVYNAFCHGFLGVLFATLILALAIKREFGGGRANAGFGFF